MTDEALISWPENGLLPDKDIAHLCNEVNMLDPFISEAVRFHPRTKDRVISYGLSSYGYDIRLSREFMVFNNLDPAVIDPKNFDEDRFTITKKGFITIPPNSFVLGRSLERFNMPKNVMGVCLGKSTYARCGIVVNVTPIEPSWRGYLTIEISNTTPVPVVVYADEGIAQILFFKSSNCAVNYDDREGKYQGQEGIVPPRM